MGSKQERTIRFSYPVRAVVAAVEPALAAIGAKLSFRSDAQNIFSARTGASIWSLGEQIQVVVGSESPAVALVHISSSASHLIDWGKNNQNINNFEQAMAMTLAAVQQAPLARAAAPAAAGASVVPPPLPPPHGSTPPTRAPAQSPAPRHRVFISYRREDSGTIVGRIHDRLVRDFGAGNVFKDIDNIPFGVDFVDHLDHEVEKCSVLFAVIGPDWLTAAADDGGRRLDDPHDFVHIEIASALRRKIPVVPILVDGARVPAAGDLPDDLKPLARRNGIRIRHDPDFHNDMSRLLSRLG